jgi:alpha-tubulin suppressor-like RCC1 family protein/photosystem II stability/assembly factor-like uncharacterized protein
MKNLELCVRKSLFVLFVLILGPAGSTAFIVGDARAQFLGQQSLSQSSYVIDQSGQLWAWGDNFYGQLGVGDRTNRNTPTQVPVPPGASKWVLIAAGPTFAIAVADSDKLYTWGVNDKGQIGNGIAGGLYAIPTRIPNPAFVTNWKWVSAGAQHCEALTMDGRLFAWGDNTFGELGIGNMGYAITPQQVQFPTGVTAWADVAAGPGYTLMLSQDGLLYGSGRDSLGTFTPWEGPALARIDTFRAYSPLPCLAASNRLEARIDQNNDVQGVLSIQDPLFYISPTGGCIEQVAAVADGGWHTLVLSMDGRIAAYGENNYGQLTISRFGNQLDTFKSVIIPFPTGVTQFVGIAAGLNHSLAIGNDGWIYAWGRNNVGELGIGAMPDQGQPVKVLQVCPPLSMTASLTVPTDFFQPYSINLSVKNKNATSSLTNVDAFMVLGSPLTYTDSVPDQSLLSPISPNSTATATWDGGLREIVYDSLYPTYFVYVRATGSAPLLAYVTIIPVIAGPWRICDVAYIEDSLTHAPIDGADLVFCGPPAGTYYIGVPFDSSKMVSEADGKVALCLKGPVTAFPYCPGGNLSVLTEYPFNILKENYRTTRNAVSEPIPVHITFVLGPSDIQGTFTPPAPQFIADSVMKVYYPDSLIGYAISRRIIFRTVDSGITWSAMYAANGDLHDIKFRDAAHGWAVGDSGMILNTTDSGQTWQTIHVGTLNLRALFNVDADTAWAVGDSGTIAKRSGNTWSLVPKLAKDELTSIHFLDPYHGLVGGNGVYYQYDSGAWSRHPIKANIRSVYYTSPEQFNLAGTNGTIVTYNDTTSSCLGYTEFDTFIIDTLITDSTYTTQTVNSLYFLNSNIGYAAGDSGASFVTYDGGTSWATMTEFPHSATSMNFFSLAGHGVSDNAVLNYTGEPSTQASIVRGRITFGDPPEPILGAEVDRWFVAVDTADTVYAMMDNAFTNDQGNFVFTSIDDIFTYEYRVHFTDSGIAKTKIFYAVRGQNQKIITLNYNDYTPPPPDTILADVNTTSNAVLSLGVNSSGSIAQISYGIPSDGRMRLTIQDILGRTVRTILDGFSPAGVRETDVPLEGLSAGAYYITLQSGESSITKKLIVLQ